MPSSSSPHASVTIPRCTGKAAASPPPPQRPPPKPRARAVIAVVVARRVVMHAEPRRNFVRRRAGRRLRAGAPSLCASARRKESSPGAAPPSRARRAGAATGRPPRRAPSCRHRRRDPLRRRAGRSPCASERAARTPASRGESGAEVGMAVRSVRQLVRAPRPAPGLPAGTSAAESGGVATGEGAASIDDDGADDGAPRPRQCGRRDALLHVDAQGVASAISDFARSYAARPRRRDGVAVGDAVALARAELLFYVRYRAWVARARPSRTPRTAAPTPPRRWKFSGSH